MKFAAFTLIFVNLSGCYFDEFIPAADRVGLIEWSDTNIRFMAYISEFQSQSLTCLRSRIRPMNGSGATAAFVG